MITSSEHCTFKASEWQKQLVQILIFSVAFYPVRIHLCMVVICMETIVHRNASHGFGVSLKSLLHWLFLFVCLFVKRHLSEVFKLCVTTASVKHLHFHTCIGSPWPHFQVTAIARKRPQPCCQKCIWQIKANYACTLRMWLCMKWHGAWLYGVHRTRRDGSSFMWHQPCQRCKYTTSVDIQKRPIIKDIHSCRITCERTESARERRIAQYKSDQQYISSYFELV